MVGGLNEVMKYIHKSVPLRFVLDYAEYISSVYSVREVLWCYGSSGVASGDNDWVLGGVLKA